MVTDKPHILYISKFIPEPTYNGGAVRNIAWLRFLSNHYHVTLVGFWQKGCNESHLNELKQLCHDIRGVNFHYSFLKLVSIILKSLFLNRSIILEKYWNKKLNSIIQDLISTKNFKFIFCGELSTLQYVKKIVPQNAVFFDDHNVEYDLIRQSALLTHVPIKWLLLRESAIIKNEELAGIQSAQQTFVVSDLDKDKLENKTIITVNNMFFDNGGLSWPDLSDNPTIIFVGNVSWKPNLNGLQHFIGKIFPIITEQIPHVKLIIAGSNISKKIKDISQGNKNITLMENVSEKEKARLIREAWVGIVPLYFGSGTRIKILEYWSYGKTVISTPKGAEGLLPSEGTIITETDNNFAEKTIELLKNKESLDQYGASNYSIFLSHYSFHKIYADSLYNTFSTKGSK